MDHYTGGKIVDQVTDVLGASWYRHTSSLKDEAQTALFKDPVRTAQ